MACDCDGCQSECECWLITGERVCRPHAEAMLEAANKVLLRRGMKTHPLESFVHDFRGRGRPKLPPGRKAVNRTFKLYEEDAARLKRLAQLLGESEAEVIRRALEALEHVTETGAGSGD